MGFLRLNFPSLGVGGASTIEDKLQGRADGTDRVIGLGEFVLEAYEYIEYHTAVTAMGIRI